MRNVISRVISRTGLTRRDVYSDISNAFGRLTLQPISRSDLGSNFTCEARNTDLVEPKGTSISLELNRE